MILFRENIVFRGKFSLSGGVHTFLIWEHCTKLQISRKRNIVDSTPYQYGRLRREPVDNSWFAR